MSQHTGYHWIEKLSEATRLELQQHMTIETFANGEFLFQAGQEADALYRVISGQVKMTNISNEGRETLYGIWKRGDIIGELGLLDQRPRMHNAQAHGEVCVAKVKRKDFQKLRDRHPEITEQLILFLCDRLRVSSEYYDEATLLDLPQRLAMRLYEMAADFGRPSEDGVLVDLGLSQAELGNLVGASRQSIGKVLNDWQKKGIIDIHYGRLTIKQLDILEGLVSDDSKP